MPPLHPCAPRISSRHDDHASGYSRQPSHPDDSVYLSLSLGPYLYRQPSAPAILFYLSRHPLRPHYARSRQPSHADDSIYLSWPSHLDITTTLAPGYSIYLSRRPSTRIARSLRPHFARPSPLSTSRQPSRPDHSISALASLDITAASSAITSQPLSRVFTTLYLLSSTYLIYRPPIYLSSDLSLSLSTSRSIARPSLSLFFLFSAPVSLSLFINGS